jgi:hypothetical protein
MAIESITFGLHKKKINGRHVGTAPYSLAFFMRAPWEILVTRSWGCCVMFCRSLFVLLSFFFWPLSGLLRFTAAVTDRQCNVQKTHRKLKIEQHGPHQKGVKPSALERLEVFAPLVAPVVLLLHDTNIKWHSGLVYLIQLRNGHFKYTWPHDHELRVLFPTRTPKLSNHYYFLVFCQFFLINGIIVIDIDCQK